jgi:hypothetical protein
MCLSSGDTNKNHFTSEKGESKSAKRCFQQAFEDYKENFFLEENKHKSTKG